MNNLRRLESIEQARFTMQTVGGKEFLMPAIPFTGELEAGRVLMLGYMNRAALEETISTRLVTFFSRRRSELWTKGKSSGNTLEYLQGYMDCDNDTLLIQVKQNGVTCHNGTSTCFELPNSVGDGRIEE